jgi:hypothetical protein
MRVPGPEKMGEHHQPSNRDLQVFGCISMFPIARTEGEGEGELAKKVGDPLPLLGGIADLG